MVVIEHTDVREAHHLSELLLGLSHGPFPTGTQRQQDPADALGVGKKCERVIRAAGATIGSQHS